jgi:hypothetical protein
MPAIGSMEPSIELSRVSGGCPRGGHRRVWRHPRLRGGTAIVRATPVLITHAEVVGWVAAAAGLLIAAAVTDLAKEWI